MAYELIETIEVGAGGSSLIDFQNIPSDATDLELKWSLRADDAVAVDNLYLRFNNFSMSSSYQQEQLRGDGSTAYANAYTNSYIRATNGLVGDTSNANYYSVGSLYVPNYALSTEHPAWLQYASHRGTPTSAHHGFSANLNAFISDAITQIEIFCSGTFKQYSTASLYKIY